MKAEENAQYVLISYDIAQKVWDNWYIWLGISSARPLNIMDHFQSFYFSSISKITNSVWRGMWLAIVSEIWRHRNKIVFNNWVVDGVEIFTLTQLKAWSWNKFR